MAMPLVCPFYDAKGNRIMEGDRIRHPDGKEARVVAEYRDRLEWNADYEDGAPRGFLGMQVDLERGQAVVCSGLSPVMQTRHGDEGNCFAACCATILGGTCEDWECEAAAAEDLVERTFRGKCDWIALAPGAGETFSCGKLLGIYCARNKKTGLGHAVVVSQEREDGGLWYELVHDPAGGDFKFEDYEAELLVVPIRYGSFISSRGNL